MILSRLMMLQIVISQGYTSGDPEYFKTKGLDRIILIRSPHTDTKDVWLKLYDIRSAIGMGKYTG